MSVVRKCQLTNLPEEPIQAMRDQFRFLIDLGTHDNLIPLDAFDITAKRCITVMPHLSGWQTLDQYIKTKLLGEEGVTQVISQAMSALQFLHRKQASHGNVCMQNILVDQNNLYARLTDYGQRDFYRQYAIPQ